MTFEQVKENIRFMEAHPYIILRKMQTSCHIWWMSFGKVLAFVEDHINDESFDGVEPPLDEEMRNALQTGLMFLPAIMLGETDEKSWEIYSSIILLTQNYASMIGDTDLLEIIETLGNLVNAKESWKALMIQCESLILQSQSMVNASYVPYNLSRKFLTSLLKTEE